MTVGSITLPIAAQVQAPGKVPRIGFLIPQIVSGQAGWLDASRAGLRDHGYVEGRNIAMKFDQPTVIAIGCASWRRS